VRANSVVHLTYARLLLFPHPLSVDYSFDCLSLSGLNVTDPRVAAAAIVYVLILSGLGTTVWWVWVEAARPKGGGGRIGGLVVGWALLLVPMVPASNVLFIVGTTVAERLLYLPSAGAALLLSRVCTWGLACSHVACLDASSPAAGAGGTGRGDLPRDATRGWGRGRFLHVPRVGLSSRRRVGVWGCLWGTVGVLAVATVRRNHVWTDETTLFRSALEVCPGSAKVQVNAGILERRAGNYTQALTHLRRALEIDPSYCDCHHWIGVTLVNMGIVEAGLDALTEALDCKWVFNASLQALHKIFHAALSGAEGGQSDGELVRRARLLRRWGGLLYKAHSNALTFQGTQPADGLETAARQLVDAALLLGQASVSVSLSLSLSRSLARSLARSIDRSKRSHALSPRHPLSHSLSLTHTIFPSHVYVRVYK